MKTIKFILFCVPLVVFKCVVAKRISEIECDELASLNTHPGSLYPYLMEVVNTEINHRYKFAVLLSENFVLTTRRDYDSPNMGVRKFKLPEEQYSDPRPYFSVKRILSDNLAVPQSGVHQLALIELNEKVPYRNTRSIYRPACLWANSFQPTNLYTWTWNGAARPMIDPYIINILNDECSPSQISSWHGIQFNSSEVVLQSHLCYAFELGQIDGNPIVLKHRGESFIFGILSYYTSKNFPQTKLAAKINSFIEWIEPKVWPRHCGQRILKHKPMMTFAQPTYHGEYPWNVAIYRNHVYLCGGTILNRRTILTAGHCIHDERGVIPANSLLIVAGTNTLIDYPIEARNFTVETIIVHENYNHRYLENDIALLKLSSSMKFTEYIQSICLSNTFDYNNFPVGSVTGWGRDENNRPSNKILQDTLPIRDNFECRESNRNFFPQYMNDHNFCAGNGNGTNICSFDRGSSMVVEFDSHFYIRGIVSTGVALMNTDLCDITELVLFTDVPKLYGWIMNNVNDNE